MKKLINADDLIKALIDRQCTNVLIDTVEYEISYITDALTIPDNPTNGDMIRAIFPNAEYKHIKTMSGIDGMEVNGINGLYDNFGHWCARDVFFHDDFWNAPYKRDK